MFVFLSLSVCLYWSVVLRKQLRQFKDQLHLSQKEICPIRIPKSRSGITEEELARAERERLLREQEGKVETLMKDVNFDYDSYTINSSELPKINAVGNYLKQNREIKIVAEGHCDERGTLEYNLALGQKRAEAVKAYLVKMGVDGSRISAISFGKEVPVDPGHAEDAWAKNRRAHFKIDQKG